MKLKVYNKAFSRDFVRAAVRAVRPPGISNFDLAVKNSQSCRGRAYSRGCPSFGRYRPYIVVAINPKTAFPFTFREGAGYLGCVTYTLDETFVYILAHELRHLWQAKVKRGRRVWGSRGQYSERDADAYAIQMLRRYRRGELAGLQYNSKSTDPEPPDPKNDNDLRLRRKRKQVRRLETRIKSLNTRLKRARRSLTAMERYRAVTLA